MKSILQFSAILATLIVLSACSSEPKEAPPTQEVKSPAPKAGSEIPRHFVLRSVDLDLPFGWYGLDFSLDLEPQVKPWPISEQNKKRILEMYSGFKAMGSMELLALNATSTDGQFVDNLNITVHAPVPGDFLKSVQAQVKTTYGSYPGYKVTKEPKLTEVQGIQAAEFTLSVDKDHLKLRAYSCIINTPKEWVQLTVVCREVAWTSVQSDIDMVKRSFKFKTHTH